MSNVTLTITGLLKDLDDGLKREHIAEKYGLTVTAVREIFKHPKLKGKQARQPRNYVLIDDTDETPEPQPELPLDIETPEDMTPAESPEVVVEEVVEAQPEPVAEPEPEPQAPQATTESLI